MALYNVNISFFIRIFKEIYNIIGYKNSFDRKYIESANEAKPIQQFALSIARV